jgi:hypothetical protein
MSTGEISRRIILAVGVALDAYNKDRRLVPLNYVVTHAQTAIYWLRLSVLTEKEEMASGIEETTPTQESIEELSTLPPTLIGIKDHLDYLKNQFSTVVKELDLLIQGGMMIPSSLYNTQRAYDKIHEALYNTELATNYHGKLTGV